MNDVSGINKSSITGIKLPKLQYQEIKNNDVLNIKTKVSKIDDKMTEAPSVYENETMADVGCHSFLTQNQISKSVFNKNLTSKEFYNRKNSSYSINNEVNEKIEKLFAIVLKNHENLENKFSNSNFNDSKSRFSSSKLINLDKRSNTSRAITSKSRTTENPSLNYFNFNELNTCSSNESSFEKSDEMIDNNMASRLLIYDSGNWETSDVLNVEFQTWFTSTHGLSRPQSPEMSSEERYYFLINNCITENMIYNLPDEQVKQIIKKCAKEDLIKKYEDILKLYLDEAFKHFSWSIRKSILDYLLKDKEEQSRLGLTMIDKVICYLCKQ